MIDRAARAAALVARGPFAGASSAPLAGDASLRSYRRLTAPDGRTAVLMDAPPEKGEDVRPFLAIAGHLAGLGLAAPRVIDADAEAGLLVLEDLGDALFARVLEREPDLEISLYSAAIDVLAELAGHPPPPDVPRYGPREMTEAALLAYDWYRGDGPPRQDAARRAFAEELEALLAAHAGGTGVLVLRDYHAENLIWLPDREGPARVGLLDFQDGASGPPAYDLVSLLKDARRDLAPGTEAAMIERFGRATGAEPDALARACAVLGAQRNLRILGTFARLSLHFGKPHYVDLIPRVWGHLADCLRHPALATLARRVAADLPRPDPDRLRHLKDRCATVPTP